jgi:hypothetical protein
MTAWPMGRTASWSAKVVIAAGLLAAALVLGVPVALLVGVIMMLAGHAVAGLALFGASVLAAVAAVTIAGLTGVRHVRKLISGQGFRVVQLGRGDYDYE